MPTHRRLSHRAMVAIPLAVTLLAACSGATPTPTPTPQPTQPIEAQVLLRVTQVQALPPRNTFSWLPSIVISLDGRVLTAGAVPAIFPGPLVNPIIERRITPAGWAKIVAAARSAGLLSGANDFTGGLMPPGAAATRLEIVADGRVHVLTGDPSRIMVCVTTPCVPQPGTPEAFGGYLSSLGDLGPWLGADLGAESEYEPNGYALIVGPPPAGAALLLTWPLEGGFMAFGKPLADGSGRRCGVANGAAAAALRPMLRTANEVTPWRDPVDGSLHGLVVRPLLSGDGDSCEGLF